MSRHRHLGAMRKINARPDLTKYVFNCPDCHWQVQAGPRARSDLGGYDALQYAIAEAALAHQSTHPDLRTTVEMSTGEDASMLIPVSLPRWWVEKA